MFCVVILSQVIIDWVFFSKVQWFVDLHYPSWSYNCKFRITFISCFCFLWVPSQHLTCYYQLNHLIVSLKCYIFNCSYSIRSIFISIVCIAGGIVGAEKGVGHCETPPAWKLMLFECHPLWIQLRKANQSKAVMQNQVQNHVSSMHGRELTQMLIWKAWKG